MSRYNSMPYLLQGIKRAQASTDSPGTLGRIGNRIKGMYSQYPGVAQAAPGAARTNSPGLLGSIGNAAKGIYNRGVPLPFPSVPFLRKGVRRGARGVENVLRKRLNTRELGRIQREQRGSRPPASTRPQQGRPQQGSQPQGSQPVNRKKFNYNMV